MKKLFFTALLAVCLLSVHAQIISPNGDNTNELFVPSIAGEIRSFRLQIFNRWGEKVFESNDIKIKLQDLSSGGTDLLTFERN